MHAEASGSMVPERVEATRPVLYTTLYDLIAAVDEAIEPGEEDVVTPIVAHVLRAGHAHFLRKDEPDQRRTDAALQAPSSATAISPQTKETRRLHEHST